MTEPKLQALRGGKKATRAPSADVVEGLERELIGKLMLDTGTIPSVLEVLEPGDISAARRPVFDVLVAQHAQGFPFSLANLAADLEQVGKLDQAGGAVEVSALYGPEATAVDVLDTARRLHKLALESRSRIVADQIAQGDTKPETHAELQEIYEQIKAVSVGAIDLADAGFSGDRLDELRRRPKRVSPFPGMLPPEPALVVLSAKPKVGKSTLASSIAQAWACGVSPWEGVPKLPGSRALVLSAEQPVERIDATLRRMDVAHDQITRSKWSERVTILARDPELSKSAARMFTLDRDGRSLLRQGLLRAKREKDPYGLVILDSLSRLAPGELDENSNMEMTAFLAPLQELAEELAVYVVVIHHVGHSGRNNAVSAGRGASAIAAVAQAVWLLEKTESNPRQRSLHVEGNAVSETRLAFEVGSEEDEPGHILYWKPIDPLASYNATDLIGESEEINTVTLAARIQDPPPKEGDGVSDTAKRKATKLRNKWEKAGEIDVRKSKKKNATMMKRIPPTIEG